MCADVEKALKSENYFCVHSVLKTLCWCWCRHGSHGLINGQLVELKPGDGTILRFVPHKELQLDKGKTKATGTHRSKARARTGKGSTSAGQSLKDRADAALSDGRDGQRDPEALSSLD